MNLRIRPSTLFCLITGFVLFITWQSRASTTSLYWISGGGFSVNAITINVGDTADIANFDNNYYLDLSGNNPNSFGADIPPESGGDYYYVPITYSSQGTFSFSDQFGNTVTVTVNPVTPLSVAITSPANNAQFAVPANFTITAVPAGGATPYLNVNFYVGTNAPYTAYGTFTYTVTNLTLGTYTLTAVVTDDHLTTATNSVSVTVNPLMATNFIQPAACADIYSSGTVLSGSYLDADANPHGALEFASFNASQYTSILLEVNPYGLPLGSTNITVYAFDGGNGTLMASNYSPATLLGTWDLPPGLNYGQAAMYDVTAFVKSTQGPYFGFVISGGGDVFSSTSKNYGLPPELYAVGPAPPPPLGARMSGRNLIISWSTNGAAGFSLMTSTNLLPGATWSPASPTPAQIGNQWFVTNSISGSMRFFRFNNP